jgi:hypothetical protein
MNLELKGLCKQFDFSTFTQCVCIKKSMNNEQIIIILINFVTFILFYSYSIMNAANIDKLNNF